MTIPAPRRGPLARAAVRGLEFAACVALLTACAAGRKGAESPPPATPAAEAVGAAPAPSPAAAPEDDAPASPVGPSPQAGATYAQPPSRTLALAQASSDVEASQRELDVAGGDCRNACRALGSMDRAAGRLCSLAQTSEEARRCEEAKARVYSARDKVRSTCGSCPDVSVDRNAPVPSR